MSNEFLRRLQERKGAPAPSTPAVDHAEPAGASERAEAARSARAAAPVTPAAPAPTATKNALLAKLAGKAPPAAQDGGNGFQGVLPPDAPSRVVEAKQAPLASDEDEGEDEVPAAAAPAPAPAPTPEKRKPGRPRKEAAPAAAAEPAASAPPAIVAAAASRRVTAPGGMALYIDCMPVKDVSQELMPTLFEDWINPALMTLNETAQAKGLADYRMLGFGEKQGLFAMAVNDMLQRNRPSVMVVNTASTAAKDALDVLIPNASVVVRRL